MGGGGSLSVNLVIILIVDLVLILIVDCRSERP